MPQQNQKKTRDHGGFDRIQRASSFLNITTAMIFTGTYRRAWPWAVGCLFCREAHHVRRHCRGEQQTLPTNPFADRKAQSVACAHHNFATWRVTIEYSRSVCENSNFGRRECGTTSRACDYFAQELRRCDPQLWCCVRGPPKPHHFCGTRRTCAPLLHPRTLSRNPTLRMY